MTEYLQQTMGAGHASLLLGSDERLSLFLAKAAVCHVLPPSGSPEPQVQKTLVCGPAIISDKRIAVFDAAQLFDGPDERLQQPSEPRWQQAWSDPGLEQVVVLASGGVLLVPTVLGGPLVAVLSPGLVSTPMSPAIRRAEEWPIWHQVHETWQAAVGGV